MFWALLAFLGTFPWIAVRILNFHTNEFVKGALTGVCMVSAGFLLTFASDSSRRFVSGALAIAVVAILAVLPEYAVDIYLSYKAGIDEQYAHYVIANMTGSNRLLIGLGWPVVLFTSLLAGGTPRAEFNLNTGITIDERVRGELFFLLVSSVWGFGIFLKRNVSLWDALFLISLFSLYIYRSSREEREELELEFEPVRSINRLSSAVAIPFVVLMFLWAGFSILISAKDFAESLISIGRFMGVSEFLLIQWVAPMASESPEFIVVLIWALRRRGLDALRALISSKVNQWTLLVGCVPLVFNVSRFVYGMAPFGALPLDERQRWEVFLTSAQLLFAFFLVYDLRFSLLEAILLMVLFFTQFFVEHLRDEIAFAYLLLCVPSFIVKFYRKS